MPTYVKQHGVSLLAFCLLLTVATLLAVNFVGIESRADAQQVLPGGKPARLQTFHAGGGPTGTWGTMVDSAPGPHGFVVTDVFVSGSGNGYARLRVNGELQFEAYLGALSYHLPYAGGWVIPVDAKVECWYQDAFYQVSGYSF